jgi:hypothetical protein
MSIASEMKIMNHGSETTDIWYSFLDAPTNRKFKSSQILEQYIDPFSPFLETERNEQ